MSGQYYQLKHKNITTCPCLSYILADIFNIHEIECSSQGMEALFYFKSIKIQKNNFWKFYKKILLYNSKNIGIIFMDSKNFSIKVIKWEKTIV